MSDSQSTAAVRSSNGSAEATAPNGAEAATPIGAEADAKTSALLSPDLLRVRRIVVGVDGSDSSLDALRHATFIATHFNSTVEAVAAWQLSAALDPFFAVQQWSPEDIAREALTEAVASVFGDSVPEWLHSSVRQGPPARVLVEASADADLLIVGSRGHGGVVGLLLGSVSASCAESARCPVLIMH